MKLSQFRFDLPLNLIAQHPTKKREDARLMVVHRSTGQIENKHFRDILDYFDDKDVFVVNNTKVFPARMYGRKEKTGAKIEVFLLRELNKRIIIKSVRFAEVTLHTGLGTFRPTEVENLSKHKMDAEYYKIDDLACKVVNKAIEGKHRICSIGTTTMRAIESSYTAEKL